MTSETKPVLPSLEPFINNLKAGERTIGFAILIIVGIGLLSLAAAGTASFGDHLKWWQAGVLSNLTQIEAIAMMAGGVVTGTTAFIVGIIYSVKTAREVDALSGESVNYFQKCAEIVKEMEYEFGTGLSLVKSDAPPTTGASSINAPGCDPLFHIPILIPAVTLNQVIAVTSLYIPSHLEDYVNQYGETEKVETPYWVLWRKGGIPNSGDMTFKEQKEHIANCSALFESFHCYQVASLIETIICMSVEKKLFKSSPPPCQCGREINCNSIEEKSIFEVGFLPDLIIRTTRTNIPTLQGIAAVVRFDPTDGAGFDPYSD